MEQIYIYSGVAFTIGFIVAWIIRTLAVMKLKKANRDTSSFFETEKLRKELLNKENLQLHAMNDAIKAKLNELTADNKNLVEDIVLLQKSNEETEAQLKHAQPELYNLKIKLIEANNEIARYKAQRISK